MTARSRRRTVAGWVMMAVGAAMMVFSAVQYGTDGALLVILGALLTGCGFEVVRGTPRRTAAVFAVTGILFVLTAGGRAMTYAPTNGLVIAFFVLGLALVVRAAQYYRIARRSRKQ